MIGDRLLDEWLALPGLNSRQRAALAADGIMSATVLLAGGLAWSRIAITGRVWEPSEAGDVFLVQGVWNGAAPSIYNPVETPLVDMIAWRLDDPTRWFYRVGDRGVVLGADHLDQAHVEGFAVVLHTTPLAWLRAQCRGVVLLDHCEAAWAAQREAERHRAAGDWWRGCVA